MIIARVEKVKVHDWNNLTCPSDPSIEAGDCTQCLVCLWTRTGGSHSIINNKLYQTKNNLDACISSKQIIPNRQFKSKSSNFASIKVLKSCCWVMSRVSCSLQMCNRSSPYIYDLFQLLLLWMDVTLNWRLQVQANTTPELSQICPL